MLSKCPKHAGATAGWTIWALSSPPKLPAYGARRLHAVRGPFLAEATVLQEVYDTIKHMKQGVGPLIAPGAPAGISVALRACRPCETPTKKQHLNI